MYVKYSSARVEHRLNVSRSMFLGVSNSSSWRKLPDVCPIASLTGTFLLLAIESLGPLRVNDDMNRLGGCGSVSPVEANVGLLDVTIVKGYFPCLLFQIILVCENDASVRMVQHHCVVSVGYDIPRLQYSVKKIFVRLRAKTLEDAISRDRVLCLYKGGHFPKSSTSVIEQSRIGPSFSHPSIIA